MGIDPPEKQNEQLAVIKNKLDEIDRLEKLRPIKGEWNILKSLEKALRPRISHRPKLSFTQEEFMRLRLSEES